MKIVTPGTLVITNNVIDILNFQWDCEGGPLDVEAMRSALIEWATAELTTAKFNPEYLEITMTGPTSGILGKRLH